MAPGWDTRYRLVEPWPSPVPHADLSCWVGSSLRAGLAGRLVREVWMRWPGSPLAGNPAALPGPDPAQEEPEAAGGKRSHWFLLDAHAL